MLLKKPYSFVGVTQYYHPKQKSYADKDIHQNIYRYINYSY